MRQSVFVPGHRGPAQVEGEVACCLFHGNRVFITRDGGRPALPRVDVEVYGIALDTAHYLGTLDGRPCYGMALPQGACGAQLQAFHPQGLIGHAFHNHSFAWQRQEHDPVALIKIPAVNRKQALSVKVKDGGAKYLDAAMTAALL